MAEPSTAAEPLPARLSQQSVLREAGEFAAATARHFIASRSLQTAGSLTFTTLLALVPLITVALALSTAFPAFDDAIGAFRGYVVEHFLPDARGVDMITNQITAFTQKAGRLTAIGLGFLAITAVMLMLTIDGVLNRVFRVQRRRPLAQRLIMYWSVLTLGPILIGASISMTSFLVGASLGVLALGEFSEMALRLLPFVFTLAAFTWLYVVVPYRRIEIVHALTGGLVASVMFELAKRGFGLYIAHFPTYSMIYGAFATLPIFLLWLYLSWLVVLLGATITAMLPGYRAARGERERPPGQDLRDAVAVLVALARAQREGEVPGIGRLGARLGLLPYRCERVLERAAALGWTARTEKDGWLLARDADSIKLADMYRAFVLDPQVVDRAAPYDQHWKHVDADLGLTLRQLAGKEEAS
ncbi:MAG: YihY family inner membrane protein [Sphingomonadaceae bacterium]